MRFNYCFCFLVLLLSGCTDAPDQSVKLKQIPEPTVKVITVQVDTSKFPTRCRPLAKLLVGSENPSRFMAQIEQESSCNAYALSRTGAIGLVQIMPPTLEWGARTFARHLGKPRVNDPRYAIEFMKAYMEYFTVDLFDDYCTNKAVDEMRYNGGYWVIWEIRHSNGTLSDAEAVCGVERLANGKLRSLNNCDENYNYPRYIARRQVKFLAMGGKGCPIN